ncbi:hypothetical protein AMS68_007424 [Peltaster fructicola]|uniref:Uncharacterized protein n=1 Tax=Peltaster fructicola TaxID=286661 RepID=A0A6H0Y4E7_9PEZI|nr:hypothetical protein AMS68_007424 [Peltaster fructicola]
MSAIRLEHQALHNIPPKTSGTLYLLEGAAHLQDKAEWPVSIWALKLPRDNHIRWFWATSSTSNMLQYLDTQTLISRPRCVKQAQAEHRRLFTTLKMLFEHFTHIPDSPDFKRAEQMTDWCVDIEDSETACQRLERQPYLYQIHKGTARDMSDDRYLLELEPAERQVASILDLTASKYLLIKRLYFKDFMNELRNNRSRIPVPPRDATHRPTTHSGRTVGGADHAAEGKMDEKDDTSRCTTPATDVSKATPKKRKSTAVRKFDKHVYRLRARNEWTWSRARACAEAWKELGFFEEESYVEWIDAGGMFETIGLQ